MSQTFHTTDGKSITYHGGPNPGPWLIFSSIAVAGVLALGNLAAKGIASFSMPTVSFSPVPIIAGVMVAAGVACIMFGLAVWLQVRANEKADRERRQQATQKPQAPTVPARQAGKVVPLRKVS